MGHAWTQMHLAGFTQVRDKVVAVLVLLETVES